MMDDRLRTTNFGSCSNWSWWTNSAKFWLQHCGYAQPQIEILWTTRFQLDIARLIKRAYTTKLTLWYTTFTLNCPWCWLLDCDYVIRIKCYMAQHYVLSLQRCGQQKASNDIIGSVLSGFFFANSVLSGLNTKFLYHTDLLRLNWSNLRIFF